MAFHQNSAPQDLRPLNVAQASATGRTQDGFISSSVHTAVNPQLAPVLKPQEVPNPGFGGGTRYAHAAHGGTEWRPSPLAPHGYVSANPSAAFGYPSIGINVGANGIDKSGNEVAPGFGHGPYVGHRIFGGTVGRAEGQNANRNGSGQNLVTIDCRTDEEQFGSDSGVGCKPHLSDQGSGSGASRLSDKVGEELVLGKTVKLLCKFGGELSRSLDSGVLKYARGETKIVCIRRDVSFSEFVQKIVDTCAQPQPVVVKYQLPDQDLDTLISVTSRDDLDHMMNECERLYSGSSGGSGKLKVFLFPESKLDSSSSIRLGDFHSSGQRNVEAVNGMMDGKGGTREESTASTTSSQNSDISSNEAVDRTVPVQADINGPPLTSTRSPGGNLAASNDASSLQLEIEQERTAPNRPSANNLRQAGGGIPSASPYICSYVDPRKENVNTDHLPPPHVTGRPSPYLSGTAGPAYAQQQFHENAGGGNSQQLISAVDRTTDTASSQVGLRPTVVLPFTHPQPNQLGHEATSGKRLVTLPIEKHHDAYQVQAPSAMVGGANGYANAAPGGAEWRPSAPAPHGYVSANPSAAFGFPNIGSNVGVIGTDKSGNEVAPGFGHGPYVGHRIMGDAVGCAGGQNANRNGSGQNLVTIHHRNDEDQFGSDSGVGHKPHLSDQGSGSGAGRLSDKVGEGLVFGKTVKLLCKFGGELSRNPDRSVLKYAGGETKIVCIRGDVSFSEFVQKMVDTCGQPVVVKYQLPDQDLEDLISITSRDDLDHMMNEYERLDSGSLDGSAKLKVFLFPDSKLDSSSAIRLGDLHSSGQRNVKAVNGMMDGTGGGTTRKESTASTTSSQNSDISINETVDRTVPVQADINGSPLTSTRSPGGNLAASNDASSLQLEIEQERTAPKRPVANNLLQAGGDVSASPYIQSYVDPRKENIDTGHLPPPHMRGHPSSHPSGTAGPAHAQQQFYENGGGGNSQQLISAVDRTMDMASSQAGLRPTIVLPFIHPQQNQLGHEATSGKRLVTLPIQKHHDACQVQAPSAMVGGADGSQVHQTGQVVHSDGSTFSLLAEKFQRFEAPALCQKALPDEVSNIVVLDKRDAAVSHLPVSSSIHHCLPLEDNIKPVPRMNDPDSTKHMVGFAGNGQSPSGVFQGDVPEPSLEISTWQNFMPDQGPLKQEALASQLVIGDSCPVGGSAEYIIEQEHQNVPEGVVACAFPTVLPSNPDLTVYEGNKPAHEVNQKKDAHHKADSEDVSAMLAERVHFCFPVSDVSGLQIIESSDIEVRQELGSGTYGTVHHGKWKGKDVAMKRINNACFLGEPSEQERKMRDFLNEAKLLADLHHPNVVAFYGVVHDGPDGLRDSVATVTEYMVDGSLRKALQKGERNFDMRKRLLIAREVAFGMEYLHDRKIVHFDLKSDNLLVNLGDPRQPTCKIGDLGLSKVKHQTLISGGMRGTLHWMAPELFNNSGNSVSEKVDVYSFGIVMWELLTGEEPYADLDAKHIIGGIVNNTLRPQVPASCDPEWKSLMERCWSSEPSERPSFAEIAKELCSLKSPSKNYNCR